MNDDLAAPKYSLIIFKNSIAKFCHSSFSQSMSYKMIKWGSSTNDKEYFMDVDAFMEARNKARKEGFQHSCHDHLLELREVFLDSTNNEVICNGCGLFIRGCAYYTCNTLDSCVFHLHEFCAHLPQNMIHLIGNEDIHKLTLTCISESDFHVTRCTICHNRLYSMNKIMICYQCCEKDCTFLVDFRCVASVLAVKDPGHRHALTPHLYPTSFLCSICGEKNDDKESLFYLCQECPFYVHDRCYPLPRTIQHPTHPHPMHIRFRLGWKCGVCDENSIKSEYGWYKCKRCFYWIHIKCTFKKSIEMEIPKLDEEDAKSMIKLVFPNKESVHRTLNQLVRKLCKTYEEEEESSDHKLLHHYNHDCLLVICETKINNQVCDACVLPIYEPPFYACLGDSCKFSLHKWCVNLPKEWKSTHHEDPQHTFVLMEKKTDEFGFHRCKMCDKVGNGFFFKCRECFDYYIDIKCASLPNFVMHETHQHPLRLLRKPTHVAMCYCCHGVVNGFVYGCVCCHVFLHVGCLWTPQKMVYWDDEHPLSLEDKWPVAISGDGTDDYFCEFCEITIDDEYWFYHCIECNKSSHIRCIGRDDLYPMLKFGDCYELSSSIHQHPLTCVRERILYSDEYIPNKRPCMERLANFGLELGSLCLDSEFCPGRLWKSRGGWEEMILECFICKIVLHPECVHLALQRKAEDLALQRKAEEEDTERIRRLFRIV